MVRVNIILPVFNRLQHTEQTIRSLYENTDLSLFDLWVSDDFSGPETGELLIKLRKQYKFSLGRNYENIGPGATRNKVAKYLKEKGLRGEYLYETDNDVYFTKGWLMKLLKVFELAQKRDVLLLGGSCHPYLQNNSVQTYLGDIDYQVGLKDAVSGYSQFMTWDTWDEYGPFDETMRNAEKKIMGSEDYAFCQKIIKDGFKVGSIEPEVVIPCGKTNTYGEKATGHETFKQVEGVKVI